MKDDTGTCNLMLLGSVGQSIVGVKAEELWDGSYEEVLFCSNCVKSLTLPIITNKYIAIFL